MASKIDVSVASYMADVVEQFSDLKWRIDNARSAMLEGKATDVAAYAHGCRKTLRKLKHDLEMVEYCAGEQNEQNQSSADE